MEAKIQMAEPATATGASEFHEVRPVAGLSDDEFQALAKSVMVAIVYRRGEGIASGLCTHFGMWARCGIKVATIQDPFGGFIEITRGSVLDLFMKHTINNSEVKYLVMIDNDEAIQWDAPLQLAMHGLPMVSGVVCGYNTERGIFACFTSDDESGVPRFPSWHNTRRLPSRGLKEVRQVGMGLCCVRKDVVERLLAEHDAPFALPQRDRQEAIRIGALPRGEDIVFSDRVRKLGFPIHVDFSVQALHYKTIALSWPVENLDDDIKADEWYPDMKDQMSPTGIEDADDKSG